MTRPVILTAMLSTLLAGASASADDSSLPWSDEVGQWFLTPFVGETFVDDDRLLDDDIHYGVALGRHLNEKWSAQLSLYGGDFGADRTPAETPSWPASFDGSINGGSFDLMRVFAEVEKTAKMIQSEEAAPPKDKRQEVAPEAQPKQ